MPTPNTQVGQSWQQSGARPKQNVKNTNPNLSKNKNGKIIQNKYMFEFGAGTETPKPHQNSNFNFNFGSNKRADIETSNVQPSMPLIFDETDYANALSPKLHSSQLPGSSRMNIPKIHKASEPINYKNTQKNSSTQSIALSNSYQILANTNEEEDTLHTPPSTPTPTRKRRTQQSPKQASTQKRTKIQTKKDTISKIETETETPEWQKRNVGTQTIVSTNFKIDNTEPEIQKNTEDIPNGVNFDSVEDILGHLGKNIVTSSNLMFTVKLFGALIAKLTKEPFDERKLSAILTSSNITKPNDP